MRVKTGHIQLLTGAILMLAAVAAQAGMTSYFIYDEAGHVIGEYDSSGNAIQEHVYLGDRPVAVVQGGSGSGGTVDYVTTDQLYTPRAVTDSSQNVVWSWSSDPFGNSQPTGSLNYNLRFAGQYFDAETGHAYNHYRDYDSGTDRYMQSDPIGLTGGLDTYLYVNANPLFNVDIMGLCPVIPDLPERPVGPPELVARYNGGTSCWWKMSTSRFRVSFDHATPCQCHKQTCVYQQFKETRVYNIYLDCKSHGDAAPQDAGDMTPTYVGQLNITSSCD